MVNELLLSWRNMEKSRFKAPYLNLQDKQLPDCGGAICFFVLMIFLVFLVLYLIFLRDSFSIHEEIWSDVGDRVVCLNCCQ